MLNLGAKTAFGAQVIYQVDEVQCRVGLNPEQYAFVIRPRSDLGRHRYSETFDADFQRHDASPLRVKQHLLDPLVTEMARRPSLSYISSGEPGVPLHLVCHMRYSMQVSWTDPNVPWRQRSVRRHLKLAFILACGYDRPIRQWTGKTFHVEGPHFQAF